MDKKKKKLISDLLKRSAYVFSEHTCNDVPEKFFENWTVEEIANLKQQMYIENETPEDFSTSDLYIPDWWLMGYLADEILKD